ncbi:metallophosphoesterase [Candidatus Nitrosotenuis uzonensis]|uniref:metallophosphoesterase n=1 Tax=Candidatus Nitrosotenuis uzonensis TaxID=1407055 RepID=UPI0019620556|nr:metallophosphoesterase [Candidatus Nitrosotenuis uzonensis]
MATTRPIPSKPALMLEGTRKYLIVTDMHIGFEAELAQKKIFVGRNTILQELLDEMHDIIKSQKPDEVILLGDIKSSISKISNNEWNEVPKFLKELSNMADVSIIPGNHDGNIQQLIPENINLISSAGMIIENTLLTHGHTLPSENFAEVDKIIIGHVHPVFFDENSILNGQQIWISLKTKKENLFPSKSGQLEIIIVPSFNRYFYATKRTQYRKSISPIIEKIRSSVSAKLVTLDGTIIGDESLLPQVL